MSDIPFVREMPFRYAEPEALGPRLRRVVARNPSQFTLYGTSTYILGEPGTARPLAIIDPGPALDEHIDAVLKALDGQPVDHIFVTHTHRDHSPAAKALQAATGAVTCGYGPHPTGRAEDGGGAPVEDGPDLEFVPEKALADGEIIVAGDVRIEAVHTPGHMSNHMCYAMPDEGILFSGDHVMAWATSVISPPDGRLCAYLASLAKVRDRDETVFWPSHGPAINNPKRLVQAHIDHRHARNEQIIARLEKSEAGIADIVADVYDGLPEDLIEAASLSVLAHLLVLRDEGRVASAGATDFTASWRLV